MGRDKSSVRNRMFGVSMSKFEYDRVNAYLEEYNTHKSRSEWIRRAIWEKMDREPRGYLSKEK